MISFIMTLTMTAFFSQVSDPRFGGTYLTLLNTVANLGSRWPIGLALFFVEPLTWRNCKELACKSHDMKVNFKQLLFE